MCVIRQKLLMICVTVFVCLFVFPVFQQVASESENTSLDKIIETDNILQKLRLTQEMETSSDEKPSLTKKAKAKAKTEEFSTAVGDTKRTVFIYKNTNLVSILTDLFYKQALPEFLLDDPESPFWQERHTGAFSKENYRFRLLAHVSDLFGFSLERKGTTYILYPPQSPWQEKMLSRFPELNAPVSLDMKDVLVVNVLGQLFDMSKLNYTIDETIAHDKITIKLHNATIGAALQAIAVQKSYEITDVNGVFVIFRHRAR